MTSALVAVWMRIGRSMSVDIVAPCSRSVAAAASICHAGGATFCVAVEVALAMWLVFVYGPFAVGKFTVATELAALTGFKLFYNYLAYDALASVFPRGEVLFRLFGRFRRDVFAEAAAT